jgi:hypothetical protein
MGLPYKSNPIDIGIEDMFIRIEDRGIRLSVVYPIHPKPTKIDKIIHQGRDNEKIVVELCRRFTCTFFGELFQSITAFKSPNLTTINPVVSKGQKRPLSKPIVTATVSVLDNKDSTSPRYIGQCEISPYFKENEKFGIITSNPLIQNLKMEGFRLPKFSPTFSHFVGQEEDIYPLIWTPILRDQPKSFQDLLAKMIEREVCFVIKLHPGKEEICLFLATKTFNKADISIKLTDKERSLDDTFVSVVLPRLPAPPKQTQPVMNQVQYPNYTQQVTYPVQYTMNSPPVVQGTPYNGFIPQQFPNQYQQMQMQHLQGSVQGYPNNQYRMGNPMPMNVQIQQQMQTFPGQQMQPQLQMPGQIQQQIQQQLLAQQQLQNQQKQIQQNPPNKKFK